MGKLLLTLFTLFCSGCTTLQPLADTQPATIQQQVKVGDTVELERMDGRRQVLKVESVSAETIEGTEAGQRHSVPLSDIKSIGTQTINSAKTWTVVGIVAVVGAVIAASSGGGGSGGGY